VPTRPPTPAAGSAPGDGEAAGDRFDVLAEDFVDLAARLEALEG
jgi:hypothetical protein